MAIIRHSDERTWATAEPLCTRALGSAVEVRRDAMTDEGHYIRPVRRATLPQEIVDAIADLIIRRIWKPGDMIPTEKDLAARFGVGRSTIREAVKSLGVLGVLEARPGEGSFVREPSSEILSGAFRWGLLLSERNLDDLVDVRMLVEAECAARAALSPTKRELQELFAIHEQMTERQRDHGQFMEWDSRFHVHIAEMAHNVIFTNIASTIQVIVRVWYPITYYVEEKTKAVTIGEHLAIARAIRAANPAAARAAMGAHLLAASGRLKKVLREQSGKPSMEPAR